MKVNVKKQRRFDRSTVIFKSKVKFLYTLKYIQSIIRILMSPCFHERCLPWFCFNFTGVKFVIV